MVVPMIELVNILFSTTFTAIQPKLITHLPSNMDTDVNINMIRRRSTFFGQISSRGLPTHLVASLVLYHERMDIQNNLLNEDKQEPVESFKLSYVSSKKQKCKIVSKATKNSS